MNEEKINKYLFIYLIIYLYDWLIDLLIDSLFFVCLRNYYLKLEINN